MYNIPLILCALLSGCLMRGIDWEGNSKSGRRVEGSSPGKVIYGVDDRHDILDYPSKIFQKFARSTAAQIPRKLLQKKGGAFYLKAKKLSSANSIRDALSNAAFSLSSRPILPSLLESVI